jgi:hypothetical protein
VPLTGRAAPPRRCRRALRSDSLAPVLSLLIAASEPSKVPFYLAGGALAAWAVLLATIGLTRPTFPYHERGQRGVIGTSLLLVVIAIAMAVVTSK